MKFPARTCTLFLTLLMGIFFLIPQVQAAKPIAKVTSFQGQVLIQSGTELVPVMRVGQFLYEGSRVQTKQGQVQVTFNDGAIIKVSPFSNTLIQEREEKSGFWVFKSKKTVRRITAFVGKLWFKSGASKRRNFLQTPTAVCGIRGSDGDFGFDNQKSYLKMYTGTAEVNGNVTRGRFKNPGKRAADKNPVYRRVERAYVAVAKARATKKPAEIAKAKVAALHVAKEASKVIKENNPDETVKMIDGEIAGTTADAGIAKEKVAVSVEELKENRQHLQQAMANAKDEKEVKMIEKALNDTGNA
ncbi:MAG: FecR domain-containing protein, partial [Desulfobacterales bacterium]|nr:FecR domain-containing protein [Candidatus Desulfatibia vada]